MRVKIRSSNWETVAFLLISGIVSGEQLNFTRSQLMTPDNLIFSVNLLGVLGHKERPEHPEETLQRTIQNLRDQGYIEFLGRGEYRLTETGVARMSEEYKTIQALTDVLAKKAKAGQ